MSNESAESEALPAGSSPQAAAPLGTTVRTSIERGDAYLSPRLYNVDITALEVVRGKETQESLKAQGLSNKPPATGFEYLLVKLNVNYARKGRGPGDDDYELTGDNFLTVSADGTTEYERPFVIKQPEPSLVNTVFQSGDSREGWILLQAPETEKQPLLVFKRPHVEGAYGIWTDLWFKLD